MSTPYPSLFKPLKVDGLSLKNRITMAPLYLGYAGIGGKVSPLILLHYKLMALSGAALIVVEGARISNNGSRSARTLACDHNRYLKGLEKLAKTIKKEQAFAGFQINPSTCRLDHQREKGRPHRSCPHALGGSGVACQGPPRA